MKIYSNRIYFSLNLIFCYAQTHKINFLTKILNRNSPAFHLLQCECIVVVVCYSVVCFEWSSGTDAVTEHHHWIDYINSIHTYTYRYTYTSERIHAIIISANIQMSMHAKGKKMTPPLLLRVTITKRKRNKCVNRQRLDRCKCLNWAYVWIIHERFNVRIQRVFFHSLFSSARTENRTA